MPKAAAIARTMLGVQRNGLRRLQKPGGLYVRQCLSTALQGKVDAFRSDVEAYLPRDGKRAVFATAWLATDNVFVALMREHFPEGLEGMSLVAIDTLHLFPTTLECAKMVEEKYGKPAK